MNNSLNNSPEKQQLTLNNNVMPKLQKRSALNAALNERVQTPNDTENDTDYGRNTSKTLSEDKEEPENVGREEIPTPSQTVNSPTFAVLSESEKDQSDSDTTTTTTTTSSSAATGSTLSPSSNEAAKEPTGTDKAGPGQADGGATPVVVVQANSEAVSTM
ncbi:hypothetical protein ACOMHN_000746 [Nucella lapillus]